jgi:hypothetical protein
MDLIVEVFSDIAKWLQYDVFSSHFVGSLTLHGQTVSSAFEAALFGAILCLSAQIFCDMLRIHFKLSGTKAHDDTMQRSPKDWMSIYVSQSLYGAALFVTYETFQIPAQ